MPKFFYPHGKPCKCGCGQPVSKILDAGGRHKGWKRYVEGHQPPRALCIKEIRDKACLSNRNRRPIGFKRIQNGGRYWEIKIDNSLGLWKKSWMYEHRFIAEKILGRKLRKDEVVHHLDGNGLNNDLANLQVISKLEHMKHHAKAIRPTCSCLCPNCGREVKHFGAGKRQGIVRGEINADKESGSKTLAALGAKT